MELEVCFMIYEDNQDENVTCSFGSLPTFVYNCNTTFSTKKLILTTDLTPSSSYSTSSHYITPSMSSVLDRSRIDTPCSPMWLTIFFGVLSFISFAIYVSYYQQSYYFFALTKEIKDPQICQLLLKLVSIHIVMHYNMSFILDNGIYRYITREQNGESSSYYGIVHISPTLGKHHIQVIYIIV